jgi:PAS domain S-box-containing protein
MASPIRVLLVAPSLPAAETAATTLPERNEHVEVTTAASVDAAASVLDAEDVDCLAVALDAPGTGLVAILETVRDRRPSLPVVLVAPGSTRVLGELVVPPMAIDTAGPEPLGVAVERAVARRRADQCDDPALLREAVDAIREAFFVLEGSGRLVAWNQRALEVTGYGPSDLAGMAATALFTEESSSAVADCIEATVETGHGSVEADLRTADGAVVPYGFTSSRLRLGDRTVGVCGIGRDLREPRRRDQQLAVLDRVLRHNVRNSINVVLGHTDRLASDHPELGASLDPIEDHARRVLDFSESARDLAALLDEDIPRTTVDLSAVLPPAVEAIPTGRADVTFEAPEHAPVVGHDRLGLAVAHLVRNAVDHHDAETPRVRVTVTREDSTVRLVVADDGPGLSPTEKAVIDSGIETPLEHGSGLGLWVVNWLVTRAGGRLEFEDREPRGTRVVVELPAADAASVADGDPSDRAD